MRFPIQLQADMIVHLWRNRDNPCTPLVLMLEPLHTCNLRCLGCGRVLEYDTALSARLSLEECIASVEECPAPVVTITGGEPTMYPDIIPLTQTVLDMGRHIQFCTNGSLLVSKGILDAIEPGPQFSLAVHLDGTRERHDQIVGRSGIFDKAIEAIRVAKRRGFRVTTNTTLYKDTDPADIEALFDLLTEMDVDGFLLSPGYNYEAVSDKQWFLGKREVHERFGPWLRGLRRRYRLLNSPIYLDYLIGGRELPCTPWGAITRNYEGWKGPCYCITDAHYATYQELLASTDWHRFEHKLDPRCADCMMHSGFEPSAVRLSTDGIRNTVQTVAWNIT
jgi:hopanoid biosynthesis associated radical SAM protein HpnH